MSIKRLHVHIITKIDTTNQAFVNVLSENPSNTEVRPRIRSMNKNTTNRTIFSTYFKNVFCDRSDNWTRAFGKL